MRVGAGQAVVEPALDAAGVVGGQPCHPHVPAEFDVLVVVAAVAPRGGLLLTILLALILRVPGLQIVVAGEVAVDRPSELASRFIAQRGTTVLHAMHSVVDWFAFAKWNDGYLVRSLSLSPDSGILEDLGERLPFEEPFWAGQHPATDGEDEYPFQFHPLELGEAALKEFFGYQLEGPIDRSLLEPESVSLIKYKRSRSPGKFW